MIKFIYAHKKAVVALIVATIIILSPFVYVAVVGPRQVGNSPVIKERIVYYKGDYYQGIGFGNRLPDNYVSKEFIGYLGFADVYIIEDSNGELYLKENHLGGNLNDIAYKRIKRNDFSRTRIDRIAENKQYFSCL